jgi:hypothetical protein
MDLDKILTKAWRLVDNFRTDVPHHELGNGPKEAAMKKLIIMIAVWGLILAGATPSLLAKDKPVHVFANFGIMLNGFIVPNDLVLGIQADVRLAGFLTLSPEFSVWTTHYSFKFLTLAPGALLNLNFGGFFIGGGLTAMRGGGYGGIASDGTSCWAFQPKFNIGLRSGHFKLTAAGVLYTEGGETSLAGILGAGVGF